MKQITRSGVALMLALWAGAWLAGGEEACGEGQTPPAGQTLPRLESWLDRDAVHVGDPVTCYLRVGLPEKVEAAFRTFAALPEGKVEIKGSGSGEGAGKDGRVQEQWFVLQSFETGVHALPPAEVSLRFPDGREETLRSSPLSFEVKSLLDPSRTPADIREIKPPLTIPVSYLRLILLIIGAVVFLALLTVIGVKVFRRKERVAPATPPRPPHAIAYEALARIKSENLPGRGRIKEYYIRVSDVVRHYLEGRFALHALERTTEEFLHEMATTSVLSLRHQELVGNFLTNCDLVKFARYGPTEREIEEVYDSAVRLVDETKDEGRETPKDLQSVGAEVGQGV